jgi:lipoate synthase
MSNLYKKKAELLFDGSIFIDPDLKLPYPFGLSTGGPNIRSKSVTLGFDKHRVKLHVSRNKESQFHLRKDSHFFSINHNEMDFIDHVSIIPNYFHAPEQVFLNLQPKCIMGCHFCSQSIVPEYVSSFLDSSKIFGFLDNAIYHPSVLSVAFTSGVYPDNKKVINKFCSVIDYVKKHVELPVGVEPYISDKQEIDQLITSGASEIKINLQISDPVLFNQLCPNLDYFKILEILDYAVEKFGKGKVCSNILYGLGESDSSLISTIELLAKSGVTSNLRMARYEKQTDGYLNRLLGKYQEKTDVNRMINLAKIHKTILKKYDLTPQSFHTMCHRCCCCDLTPFIDF